MKLDYNTKMFITITTCQQLCRLYVLKWPLPFLSSPTSLLPTVTDPPRLFMTLVHYHSPTPRKGLCILPAAAAHTGCFLPAFAPTCNSQWACSCLQPPLCFLWDGVGSPYQGTTSTQFLQALIKPESLVQTEEEHLFGSALVTPSKPEVALLWDTLLTPSSYQYCT